MLNLSVKEFDLINWRLDKINVQKISKEIKVRKDHLFFLGQ
jgi:hypothetical protein